MTPKRKFTAKILAQNRAALLYRSSPRQYAIAFKITISGARPMVSWGNR